MREIEKINHTGEVPVMEPQRQFYFMDLAKQYVTQISRNGSRTNDIYLYNGGYIRRNGNVSFVFGQTVVYAKQTEIV